MHDELKDQAARHGREAFGASWRPDGWSIAPGRIELIGNHIDYNGGPVLAAAIDRVIAMASGPIDDPRQIALVAPDATTDVARFAPLEIGDWRSSQGDEGPIVYVKGIVAALLARRIPIRTGVGLAAAGNIPPGFGMSSSAALCLATILALTVDEIDPYEMVAIAREAEHRAGSPVGAMDQSASVAGNVILFDGRDNTYASIAPDLDGYVFAVADSGVDRSLRTSSYGRRVEETEDARKRLAQAYDLYLPNLAALEPHWKDVEPTIDRHLPPVLARRVRHVVTETVRVRDAEDAARKGDWAAFGNLMNASGESSATDYEISHPIVEELVTLLRSQDGVVGARMMGGGEGGPALVLLQKDAVEPVRATLEASFYADHPVKGAEPFQVCSFGPGAHREPV
jgi:galactokinase